MNESTAVPSQPAPSASPGPQPHPPRTSDYEPDWEALEAFTRQLPTDDGVPLDSPWHRAAINLLIELLTYLWRDRNDFYVGGNMFIYYSLQHFFTEDFRGPDFYYVHGVDRRRPRDAWIVWKEGGKYPDLIVELLSPSTARVDRTTKKDLYEQTFRTAEYYCYDPTTHQLEGWHLAGGRYRPMTPDERGWIWSEVLQLWLGNWVGEFQGEPATWLRFYDAAGQLVLLQAEAEHQHAEAERQKANAERQKTKTERQRVKAAQQQAEAERQRADAAEAEVARLKALLAEKGPPPG